MAKQTITPEPWKDEMSDGCSGVFDFYYGEACRKHDEAYHYGGDVEDKLIADGRLYQDMCDTPGIGGWLARRGWARIRYNGVRMFTYNYPPGHEMRKDYQRRVEAWNWLGPGPAPKFC